MRSVMRRTVLGSVFVLVAIALAVLAVFGLPGAGTKDKAQPVGPPDTYVAQWDAIGAQALASSMLPPSDRVIIFAYVSIAVYDAVVAVKGGYEPFAVDRVVAPEGASAQAAVVAAAYRILSHYLPARAGELEAAYAASLATIPDTTERGLGVSLGEQVAAALIERRAGDGFRKDVKYTPPDPPVPGVWLPTASTPPIGTYLPGMVPFSIASADKYRPGPPPALDSKRWASDYNEVKEIGSPNSATRTPEQTQAARFWGEASANELHGGLRKFVLDRQLDVVQAARVMAMAAVISADGEIACWDAKYHYAFWRPITAIRAGDTDANDATEADPAWTPLLAATPNHPEYPSAHSCITPGVGVAIEVFLGGKQIDFTVPSLTLGDRTFATQKDLEYDVGNARIWGGIHYRSAIEEGTKIAKEVADQVLSHHFSRARD